MTKYILHGGVSNKDASANKKFFSEIVKDRKSPINVLCVYFARDKKEWERLFEQDKLNFLNASQKKKFKFVLADYNLENFKKQIRDADVVYLRGGRNKMIFDILSKMDNLKSIFANKVVAGSSAGANVLSKYYYSNSSGEIKNGLGILPIKTIPHYTKEKYDIFKKLESHKENLKVYKIPEGKFFVVNEQ